MKPISLYILVLLSSVAIYSSCSKESVEPRFTPTPFELEVPEGFPAMKIPEDNPMTLEGVTLGRMLYYDSILDINENRACASCHLQSKSFSSTADVIPHINLGWSRNFLWDSEVSGTLEDIMLFESKDFFQTDLSKLNNHPDYPGLFKKAFGTDNISYEEISKALAQFSRTQNSGNSKYDRFIRDEENFTEQEFLGYNLFFSEEGDCFHCHATAFFTDNQLHNNALDENPSPGFFAVTGDPLDFGKFKSPTLRNIEYTGPYMHDGRYNTLEEVVDFYSSGLQKSETVDPLMKNLNTGGVQLTSTEKAALVAFLKTLSDPAYLTNPDLADPIN